MVINMSEHTQKLKHSPRLSTIKMVEKTLRDMDESVITIAGLKKILPKQINHNTLKTILEYLEESRKIYVGIRGVTWTYNNTPEMKKTISESIEVTPEHFQE